MSQRFDEDSELAIDGLRGIAALLVLVTHAFDVAVSQVFGWDMAGNPAEWRWARASAGHGGYWVWCFFMISGLCIHQSISRSVASGTFDWWRYLLARVSRIYPLFLLGLMLAVVPWIFHDDFGGRPPDRAWPQFLASLLSLHIFTTSFPGFETSWSLSCEMLYYIAWPVILLGLRGRVSRAVYVALGGSLVALAGILLTWRVLHKMEHSAALDGLWTVMVLFPVWICGAWLANHWTTFAPRITRGLWIASLGLCALAELLLVILKFHQFPGWAVHAASWASIPGLLIFLAGARHARLSSYSWSRPVCRWLGQFSYPCYVLHLQALLIVNHYLMPVLPKSVSSHPLYNFPLLLAPVLTLLAFGGPPLERRLMRWRAQLLARPAAAPEAVQVT
ncbi:MAG TPA: acyltransferase [Prosthecobacter sp.]|nr:acyltransferase [Prosthecobacter sp.]